MTDDNNQTLDHEYDGIQEMDNNLPRWWLYLFYVTIIWGALYVLYYDVTGIGYSQEEEYLAEMDPNYMRVSSSDHDTYLGILPEYRSSLYNPRGDLTPRSRLLTSGDLVTYVELSAESDTTTYMTLTDPGDISVGKEVYIKNCVQCHGIMGEGGIGPNLTDDYWLHGAGMTNVMKSVKYGYPAKGMISWRGFIKPDQMIQLASYVLTLHGTNPPNAKAPEGDLVLSE